MTRVAFAALLVACTPAAAPSTSAPPRVLVVPADFRANRSYVWQVDGRGVNEIGDNAQPQKVSGDLIVDVAANGEVHVVARGVPLRAMTDRDLLDGLLPPLEPSPHPWTIPGLGVTHSSVSPDHVRIDTVVRVGIADVQIHREGTATAAPRYEMTEHADATAALDPAAPRYARITWKTAVESSSSLGSTTMNMRSRSDLTLTFDGPASAARTNERRRLDERAAAARAHYSTWLAGHGAASEIAAAATALTVPTEALRSRRILEFYIRRDGRAVGRALLDVRPEARAPLLLALRISCDRQSADLVEGLRPGVAADDIREAVDACAKKVAPSSDDPAAVIRNAKNKDDLLTVGTDVLTTSPEAYRAVPAIIDWLDREPDLAAQWLEGITRQPFGTDATKSGHLLGHASHHPLR